MIKRGKDNTRYENTAIEMKQVEALTEWSIVSPKLGV